MEAILTFTLTPVENVDFEKKKVLDPRKIFQREFALYALVQVLDLLASGSDDVETIAAIGVSCIDHYLILGERPFKILHCLPALQSPDVAAFPC